VYVGRDLWKSKTALEDTAAEGEEVYEAAEGFV